MGRKRTPGLYKREEIWHIDKRIRGTRLCESTGERSLQEAELYLARRVEQVRHAMIFGDRPDRTFRQAATKFLLEHQHKRSIADDAMHLRMLDPFIGDLALRAVHPGALLLLEELEHPTTVEELSFETGWSLAEVQAALENLAAAGAVSTAD